MRGSSVRCSAVLLLAVSAFDAALGFVPSISTSFRRALSPSSSNVILQVAVDTSEIKNGMTIELDNEPYKVLGFSIMKQARGAAKTTIKFKNLIKGTTIENTYRSGEKFETALIEKTDAQFTYKEGVRSTALVFCRLRFVDPLRWMPPTPTRRFIRQAIFETLNMRAALSTLALLVSLYRIASFS
jgi:dUTPase